MNSAVKQEKNKIVPFSNWNDNLKKFFKSGKFLRKFQNECFGILAYFGAWRQDLSRNLGQVESGKNGRF